MFKKVIVTLILMCLMFSISVTAENQENVNESTPEISQQMPQGTEKVPDGERVGWGIPPSGGEINGEMFKDGMKRGQMPTGEFAPPQGGKVPQNGVPQMDADTSNEDSQTTDIPEETNQMPEGMGSFLGNIQNSQSAQQQTGFFGFVKTYSTPIISLILLIFAFVFVIFYKRKNY